MAMHNVTGEHGPALCKTCWCDLFDAFMNTGCGQPIAICTNCKRFHVPYGPRSMNGGHDWVLIEDWCLKTLTLLKKEGN